MTDIKWGAPLTGAQMKLLRAAGLPDGTKVEFFGAPFCAGDCKFSENEPYRLPIDHTAYTLAKAGWLDGRNVALWFGGEKAPDDWDGGVILTRGGYEAAEKINSPWWHYTDDKDYSDIIAYTRKAEYRKETVNVCQSFDETVTIAKMTEAEAMRHFNLRHEAFLTDFDAGSWAILRRLGLIREPTRLERFWATRDTKDVYGPPCKAFQLIEEALNFEK